MNTRVKVGIVIILASPRLFILIEYLMGMIDWKLFLFLSILYLVAIPSLVLFVIINYKKTK